MSSGVCKAGSPHLSSIAYRQQTLFPTLFAEKWCFVLSKDREDWYSAAAGAATGEKVVLLQPAARFSVLSVLGNAVP